MLKALPRLSALLSLGVLFACAAPDSSNSPVIAEKSVKPGINKGFLSEKLDVKQFTKRFEGESREIFKHRTRIARAVGAKTGMSIADIGAGTGLFCKLFEKDVGSEGKVYAVDISPKFLEHLKKRFANSSVVTPVMCTEKSTELPAASVDVAFVCDTYHHFEYPRNTLASLHASIRPGGSLVIVDFERIPGVSREWTLKHVRAGKEVVTAEITAAGFELLEEVEVEGIKENYFLRFKRK